MITARLLLLRRDAANVPASSPYVAKVFAMLIESAAIVLVFELFFLISFDLGEKYGIVALQSLVQVQVCLFNNMLVLSSQCIHRLSRLYLSYTVCYAEKVILMKRPQGDVRKWYTVNPS